MNKNSNGLTILSYLSILFLVPMFLVKNSRFTDFHVKQGFVLFICSLIVGLLDNISDRILSLFLPDIALAPINYVIAVLTLLYYTLIVLGVINVVKGEEKKLPIIGGFAK